MFPSYVLAGDPATPCAAASPAAHTPFSEGREARRLSSHGGGRAAAAAPDSPVTPGCLPLSSRRTSGAGAASAAACCSHQAQPSNNHPAVKFLHDLVAQELINRGKHGCSVMVH
jgi:hypothetical protein